MRIVIQNLKDQTTAGFAQALQYSGFEVLLWEVEKKPIFDLLYEIGPEIVFLHSSYFKGHEEEVRAAREKYGSTIIVAGLEYDYDFMIGRTVIPFANIIEAALKQPKKKYSADISMIIDYIRQGDYDYVDQIINTIKPLDINFKIYGKVKLNTPYYVGEISREENQYVYASSKALIDLYGEHYLGPFLYGNLGLCEMVNRRLFPIEEWWNISTLDDLKALKLHDKKTLKGRVLNKHTNFDEVSRFLGAAGFVDQSLNVLEAKRRLISEYWNNG